MGRSKQHSASARRAQLEGAKFDWAQLKGATFYGTQLGALGLRLNMIVLWQTAYMQAALDHLAANGHHPDPAHVARFSPLGHPTINLQGRYHTTAARHWSAPTPPN